MEVHDGAFQVVFQPFTLVEFVSGVVKNSCMFLGNLELKRNHVFSTDLKTRAVEIFVYKYNVFVSHKETSRGACHGFGSKLF
jgi:hypothetical protein